MTRNEERMTLEEMVEALHTSLLTAKEADEIIAALRAGQEMRMCGTTTGAALRRAHEAWDAATKGE